MWFGFGCDPGFSSWHLYKLHLLLSCFDKESYEHFSEKPGAPDTAAECELLIRA